jgi:hypothetical protein
MEWVLVIVTLAATGVDVHHIPMKDKDACFAAMVSVAAMDETRGDPFRRTFCLNTTDGRAVG